MSLGLLAALAVLFCFMNGANDAGTMAASAVSSRALSPRRAILLASLASFLGAMALGSAVARTFGEGLLRREALAVGAPELLTACVAAAAAALAWCGLGWQLGLPSSYTHALLGGWLGAFTALAPAAVEWRGAGLVLAGVLLTPLVCLAAAWAAMRLLLWAGSELSLQTKPLFRAAETAGLGLLCLAHGANASQKGMALLAFGSAAASGAAAAESLPVPFWARLLCAAAFSAGVLSAFPRTLKMVGFKVFRVDTLHSVCALASCGALLWGSTILGLPLSAGQVNSSALLGAGAGSRSRVRWDMAVDFLANWALTFPVCAVLSYAIVKVVR